jgi:hypothetical protein
MGNASPNRAFMKPCSIASPNVHTWSMQGCAYTHARVHKHVYAPARICTGIHILRMNARTSTLRTTVCGASQVRCKRVRTHARDVKRAGTALGRHRVCVRARLYVQGQGTVGAGGREGGCGGGGRLMICWPEENPIAHVPPVPPRDKATTTRTTMPTAGPPAFRLARKENAERATTAAI